MKDLYIICHMLVSRDGKVTGDFLKSPKVENSVEEYYEINRKLKCNGYICGRTTMKESFAGEYYPHLDGYRERKEDLFVAKKSGFYAISMDRLGRVGWTNGEIEDYDEGYSGAHIVSVMTKSAPFSYRAYLEDIGASYICIDNEDFCRRALVSLKENFGIERLLLEGGSEINGAFLREDLIDELSLVRVDALAKEGDKPLFYGQTMDGFELISEEKLSPSAVWERYRRKK